MIEGLLFLLLALWFFIAPFAVVIALVVALRTVRRKTEDLKRRAEEVERRMDWLAAELGRRAPAAAEPIVAPHRPETPPPAVESIVPEAPESATPSPSGAPPVWREVAPPAPPTPPPAPPRARAGGFGFEEKLIRRGVIWIASIALALAGIYLVKFTFDRGLLGPAARVILGIVFGVVMLGAGEWLRARAANIAQALSAAGIAVLYASFLAGTTLYHLISPGVGFLMIAVTTAAAVILSLRQGVLIAALGLVGGFITPALIGSEERNAPALFGFFLLLQVGLLLTARPRRWWPLLGLTLLGGVVWTIGWMAAAYEPQDSPSLGLFLLGGVVAFLAVERWRTRVGDSDDAIAPWLVVASGVSATILLAALVDIGQFGVLEWIFLGMLAAGGIVLARLDVRFEILPWIAALAGATLLALWHDDAPAAFVAQSWAALCYGGLIAAGAFAALWRAARPERWAALSGATGFGYFLIVWAIRETPPAAGWGATSLVFGALYCAATAAALRRRGPAANLDFTIAALAAATTAFVSAAVPLELKRFSLTVAWALEAPALLWLDWRLRVRALRVLAAALAAAVLVRLMLNPWVLGYDVGTIPVFNWILLGYGVPAAALALAAHFARRADGGEGWSAGFEGGAIVLALGLLALQVRHYFHVVAPHDAVSLTLGGDPVAVAECGAVIVLWLLFGWALLRLDDRLPRASLHVGARATLGLAAVSGLTALTTVLNPYLVPRAVGATPVFNAILLAYGAPAVLTLLLAREFGRRAELVFSRGAAICSLLFWFLLVNLQVRQAFHGRLLTEGTTTSAETYAYSAAWVIFGVTLLVVGIATRGVIVRWASLAVMLLAVGKVFLFDLAELRDLLRVLSLLGLGASLLLLAFLYQRFVFRRTNE